jgi:hypothetical protein
LTQYEPGVPAIVICAADPALAAGVELVSEHVVVPLGVPRPRPTVAVDDGLRPANVTLILPACVTVKVNTFDPCTASVPENVSVGISVVVGDVVL